MSHQLETNGNRVAFVDNRDDAWHRLNQLPKELVGQKLTPADALKHGHLANWDVDKFPLLVDLGNGKTVPNPGKFATGRTNPWTGEREIFTNGGIGTNVGTNYVPIQNEDNIDVLQHVIDETGATIETAGSLNEGKNVFVTMKLPDAINVAGTDQHDLYIAGLNSHDGTSAYTLLVTPVRIVCANTQNYALKHFVNKHSIRHTKNATRKIQEVREALGLTFKYMEEFEAEAERLLNTPMSDKEFVAFVNKLWVPDDEPSKRGATITKLRNDQLMQLFADAETQANIRLTRWAGLQAVTEYVDHFASVNAGAKATDEAKAIQRAERSIIGSQSVRQNAFDLLTATNSKGAYAKIN